MRLARRFFVVLALAFALLAGQQAAALHALAHATEQVRKGDTKPANPSCEQCSLYSQLGGGATASTPAIALVTGDVVPVAQLAAGPGSRPRLAFRSRAPPVLA